MKVALCTFGIIFLTCRQFLGEVGAQTQPPPEESISSNPNLDGVQNSADTSGAPPTQGSLGISDDRSNAGGGGEDAGSNAAAAAGLTGDSNGSFRSSTEGSTASIDVSESSGSKDAASPGDSSGGGNVGGNNGDTSKTSGSGGGDSEGVSPENGGDGSSNSNYSLRAGRGISKGQGSGSSPSTYSGDSEGSISFSWTVKTHANFSFLETQCNEHHAQTGAFFNFLLKFGIDAKGQGESAVQDSEEKEREKKHALWGKFKATLYFVFELHLSKNGEYNGQSYGGSGGNDGQPTLPGSPGGSGGNDGKPTLPGGGGSSGGNDGKPTLPGGASSGSSGSSDGNVGDESSGNYDGSANASAIIASQIDSYFNQSNVDDSADDQYEQSYTIAPNYDYNQFAKSKRGPCEKSDDELFEEEVVRGGCRDKFVQLVKSNIRKMVYITIPPFKHPSVDRERISQFMEDNAEKAINDNATPANAADALAFLFQVACGAAPGAGAIGTVAKPYFRRAALHIMWKICRDNGCCVQGSLEDLSCCPKNDTTDITTTDRTKYTLAPDYNLNQDWTYDKPPFTRPKKRPCAPDPDEQFEEEVVRGGCRARLIRYIRRAITIAVFYGIPNGCGVDRRMIAEIIGQNIGKLIQDNLTGGNIADIVALIFQIVASSACGAAKEASPACSAAVAAATPFVRKAVLEALRATCRASGCCVPGPDAECCGFVKRTGSTSTYGPDEEHFPFFENLKDKEIFGGQFSLGEYWNSDTGHFADEGSFGSPGSAAGSGFASGADKFRPQPGFPGAPGGSSSSGNGQPQPGFPGAPGDTSSSGNGQPFGGSKPGGNPFSRTSFGRK